MGVGDSIRSTDRHGRSLSGRMQRRVSDEVLDSGEDQWYWKNQRASSEVVWTEVVVVSGCPAARLRWEDG